MKFQDSSFNGLKVTVGTKKCDPRMLQKQYAASTFSKFFLLSLPVHSGSLKRIDYPKQLSGPPSFF